MRCVTGLGVLAALMLIGATTLGAAAVDTADPVVRYHAALFLGDAEQSLGRLAEARIAYAEATRLFPRAQSAHLASSHLARQRGDRDAAASALDDALQSAAAVEEDDPWWMYYKGEGRSATELLDTLRAPFLDGHRR